MLIFLYKKKRHIIVSLLITMNQVFIFNISEIAAFHLNELEAKEESQETSPLIKPRMKKDQAEDSTEVIQSTKRGCSLKLIELLKRIFLRQKNIEGQHRDIHTELIDLSNDRKEQSISSLSDELIGAIIKELDVETQINLYRLNRYFKRIVSEIWNTKVEVKSLRKFFPSKTPVSKILFGEECYQKWMSEKNLVWLQRAKKLGHKQAISLLEEKGKPRGRVYLIPVWSAPIRAYYAT